MKINIIIAIIIILLILSIIFYIIKNKTKNKKINNLWKVFLILSIFCGIYIVIYYIDKFYINHLKKEIEKSSKSNEWSENPDLLIKTINKCRPFMTKKYKKDSGDLYSKKRLNKLKNDIENNVAGAKDHLYSTAVSCLNLARSK